MIRLIQTYKSTNWHMLAIVALLYLGGLQAVYAQSNLDSLRILYENAGNDSLKYETVRKYEQATRKVDRVAALPLMKQRVKWAQVNQNDDWLMKSYLTLGNNYMFLSKLDSAEVYLDKTVNLSLKLGENNIFNSASNNLAYLFQNSNKYEEAIEVYHNVIMKADSVGDAKSLIGTNINLGLVLIEQEDFKRALSYLVQVEPIFKSLTTDDESLDQCRTFLTPAFLNLGNCYFKLGEIENAKDNFSKAGEYLSAIKDEYSIAYFKSYIDLNLGIIELDGCIVSGDCSRTIFEELVPKSISAVNGFESIDFQVGLCEAKLFQGRLFARLGRFEESKELTTQGLVTAQDLNLIHAQESAYKNLAFVEQELGNLRNSIKYLKLERMTQDSIMNSERDKVWLELEKKFETAQQENKILRLELINEEKTRKQNRQTFAFIVSFLSLIGGGYFIYSRYKIRKERELAQFERDVNAAMSRFVPMSFIRAIGREEIIDVELGDKVEKEVTVVFTDIRGFTTLSEGLTPDENFNFVKEYAGLMGPIIENNHGFINQYLGDGIMAIFDRTSTDALKACIGMQSAISEFNIKRIENQLEPIRVGMGMHTGPLILGIIGDQVRRDATIISDTVNSAARIESTSKMYTQDILLSSDSFENLDSSYQENCDLIGDIEVKGKIDMIKVYAYQL